MGFFSKDIKSLDDLFVHTLRDIYYAEKKIKKALPDMIDKATNPQLRQGSKRISNRRKAISRASKRSSKCMP